MKKLLLILLVLALVSSLVLAAGPQGNGQDTGQGAGQEEKGASVEEQGQTQNQGEEQNIMVQQRQQVRAQNENELAQMIQQRQREMNQELEGMNKNKQKVFQNQNQVRLAVHSLLAMEDLVGGIGPQVREIARNFNNSVQATIRAEEKIQTKSGFARFFTGGDEKAADEIEQEVNRNQERIQNLNQLMNQCECSEEVKAMMQEQIQNMEQEQNRLQELAQKEKKSKGLFGWLWK